MKVRTTLFLILCGAIWLGETVFDNSVQPTVGTQLSIQALNGGDAQADRLRDAGQVFNQSELAAAGLTLLAAGVCFGSCRTFGWKGKYHA